MTLQKKTDLRVQKTKNAIRGAFKEMICEMDASKITVKELSARAQIHRKTFYLHYSCIESLYEELLCELSAKYYEQIDQLETTAPFADINRIFFTFMADQEPYMEKIICSSSYREFADRFFLSMLRHNRIRNNPYAKYTEEAQNIINTFLSVNSVQLYRQWVSDQKKLPLKDLIDLSGQLFTNGISSIL